MPDNLPKKKFLFFRKWTIVVFVKVEQRAKKFVVISDEPKYVCGETEICLVYLLLS